MRPLILLLLCAASLSSGCDSYDESLLSGEAQGCPDGAAKPPSPPTMVAPGDDVPEVVFALRDVTFNQRPTLWETLGYDLDNRCTDVTNNLSECAIITPAPQLDGERGIDNVFGSQLYALVNLQYEGRPGVMNDTLDLYGKDTQASGESVIIVRIRNWNGEANDDRVTVDISTTVYGLPGDGSDTPPDATPCDDGPGDDCVPGWAGTGDDWFWVREDSFLVGDQTQPKIVDENAYITDNTFVMRIPDRAQIRFTGSILGLNVALTQGVATALISEDRQTLTAVVSGRWAKNDLIETAENVGVCSGTPTFDALLLALNSMLDVRSDPETAAPDVPCDAISMAIGFNGFRARVAGLETGAEVPSGCPQ